MWLQSQNFGDNRIQDFSRYGQDLGRTSDNALIFDHELRPAVNEVEVVTLKEGEEAVFVCRSYGSRPSATYVWKKNDRELREEHVEASVEKLPGEADAFLPLQVPSISVSKLRFTPGRDDHESVITCQAFSPHLPKDALIKAISVNVLCEWLANYFI